MPPHPPYPSYKPSGIEWLGNIPEKWDEKKLKFIARVKPSNVDKKSVDGESAVELCNYVDVYYNDQITRKIKFMKATATPSQIGSFELQAGDVVITKDSEDWEDIAVPAHVPANLVEVLCGYHLAILRPSITEIIGKYLFWSFISSGVNDQFKVGANGITRYGLGTYNLGASLIPIPPLNEQQAIADFLDRWTAKIDSLIAKKKELIVRLKEKRQATITQAVTKGLDATVPMKESGIEWLGEVPEAWEVVRHKYILKNGLANGIFKKQEHHGSGTLLLNVVDVYRDDFLMDYMSLGRVECSEMEKEKYSVLEGDVFFVRSSLKVEGIGKSVCAIEIPEHTVFECHVVRARPNKSIINPKFLINFLNSDSAINRLISLSNTVTMTTIDQDKIKNLDVPFPSRDEQDLIVDYIDQETTKIDALLAKVETAMYRLKEYRTALIAAAVTGKIDVRGEE